MAQVLGRIPKYRDPKVLVGFDLADDAGVFQLDEHLALVQTVDFFTPIVDDPFAYGAIAAANSLSDVYAMGGRPATAMAIACFPEKGMDLEILTQMMLGGLRTLREAGVALLGGHTVSDKEIKFGYSVTGLIHPDRIVTNSRARPGDRLVLTKPLGIGILTSGIKSAKITPEAIQKAVQVMTTLNRSASEVMLNHPCHAATDITGNGLLGHAYEIAEASRVTIHIQSARVPYIEEAFPLAEAGAVPGAVGKTWKMIEPFTVLGANVGRTLKNILLDPQTSGGLLISVGAESVASLLEELAGRGIQGCEVGFIKERSGPALVVD